MSETESYETDCEACHTKASVLEMKPVPHLVLSGVGICIQMVCPSCMKSRGWTDDRLYAWWMKYNLKIGS